MFNLLGWILKTAAFAVVVLVLGSLIHWDGRTVSDQIKMHLAHAERASSVGRLRQWGDSLVQDARIGAHKLTPDDKAEAISDAEKKKLRNLLRE